MKKFKLDKKTYRFVVSGNCELDISASNYEKATEKCKEHMEEMFSKDLFTRYEFLGEVKNEEI